MRLLPENQVDVLEWLGRWSLDAVRFPSGTLSALVARHLPVYPLRSLSSFYLTRSRPTSDQFDYTIALRADRIPRLMQFKWVCALRKFLYLSCRLDKVILREGGGRGR